jgi:hypothetical protein
VELSNKRVFTQRISNMKTTGLFLLAPLAARAIPVLGNVHRMNVVSKIVSNIIIETRQIAPEAVLSGITAMAALLPATKPAKIENVEPNIKRPGVKRIKVFYGPFTLLGANVIFSSNHTRK